MVLYEVFKKDDKLIQSAHVYISDEENHGWYSAIPAYSQYLRARKSQLKLEHGIDLICNVLFSDRGPGDFWCAPFIGLAAEIAKKEKVAIIPGTTASGHGKYIHDQIGGGDKCQTRYGFRNDHIKISGKEIATEAVKYLNETRGKSISGSITRNYYVLKRQDIKVRLSPIKTLEIGPYKSGISEYHCCYIDVKGNVKFRKYSCFCEVCIATLFEGNCHIYKHEPSRHTNYQFDKDQH